MPDIERWDPGESGLIRNWIGRFIDDPRFLFPWPEKFWGTDWFRRGANVPAFDVYETDTEVVIKGELPGLKPGDINIMVYPDHATISGKISEEAEEKGVNYYRRERRAGSFERTFGLPAEVNTEGARATFEHGVLELRVPKVNDVKKRGRKVEISPGEIKH